MKVEMGRKVEMRVERMLGVSEMAGVGNGDGDKRRQEKVSVWIGQLARRCIMSESNTRKMTRVALSRKHVNSKHISQPSANMCKIRSAYCQIMTDADS